MYRLPVSAASVSFAAASPRAAFRVHLCQIGDGRADGLDRILASVQHKDKTQFDRILTNAYNTHKAKGSAYGVSTRLNYATERLPSFADVPTTIVPPPTPLPHLPFAKLNSPGFVYSTLL